ncbi:ring-1,2-phenylacetyl-CoA epoxidase subunit PaaC [Actinopolymorpha cephalotaxi]|uniref:Ring-1,2-phenylacetyl-CoA epoxidase subunit PaaC n=1 Tax=Actinopolymorpha cephalotaxi TaxID=504797 RepID=A0A1I2RE08_9ACTN|nr:1,2-phenylacetyl-CoA epoxidase subunit PaaC [Actinopolymorpha cephalotaxi]NYH82319.1 ring-1,2-phenylacetyl-CoA epoxidase subunit PaaC [Actinopolymorpha cephalotaxi]SFG36837.1 ring-1,2-phenylacetyl-CoA epoxidase subunit PaaC [Actinopolymorpha cephalotaxi]
MTAQERAPATPGLAGAVVDPPVAVYATRLGDDALILAQRLGGWITNAPQLEEDVALANLGLDLLGQARMLLTYAGEREGLGRDEDALAYSRDERGFCNVTLVERADADFGEAMARLLVFSAYQLPLYERLSGSADPTLAAIAAKAVKEVAYHRDHATQWVLRLGDGTAESHRRMQAGVDSVWPHVDELFGTDDLERALVAEGVAVDRPALRDEWETYVRDVLTRATLTVPEPAAAPATGGRAGVHTEAMGYLLAEMQHLVRSHPGATW